MEHVYTHVRMEHIFGFACIFEESPLFMVDTIAGSPVRGRGAAPVVADVSVYTGAAIRLKTHKAGVDKR